MLCLVGHLLAYVYYLETEIKTSRRFERIGHATLRRTGNIVRIVLHAQPPQHVLMWFDSRDEADDDDAELRNVM